VLAYTLAQYLRRCSSFSRRLDHQPFGGGTDVGEKVVQFDLRPQEGLHPPVGEGLEMPDVSVQLVKTRIMPPLEMPSRGQE